MQRIAIGISFVALVAAVTGLRILGNPAGRYDIDAETVASQTVQAAFSFDSEDLEATREARDQAAALVPAMYSIDRERVTTQLLTLQQRITTLKDRRGEVEKAVRDALLASTSAQSVEEVVTGVLTQVVEQWKTDPLFAGFPDAAYLKSWIQPDLDTLPKRTFEEKPIEGGEATARVVTGLSDGPTEGMQFAHLDALTKLALEGLEFVLVNGVLQQSADIGQRIIVSRSETVGELPIKAEIPAEQVLRPESARVVLRQRIETLARQNEERDPGGAVRWTELASSAFEMAKLGVTDSLLYDQVLTEGERQLARSNVEPVRRPIETNQIIQEEGYRWNEQTRHDARAYWDILEGGLSASRNVFSPLIANAVLVALLLWALVRSMPQLSDRRSSSYTALNAALLIMCGVLVIGRVVQYLYPSGYLVPMAAGAMLLTILTNPRLASMTTLIMALLLSVQYGQDWRLFVVSGAMAYTGVLGLYTVRRRTDMARAALRATGVGLVTAAAVALSAGTLFSWQTGQLLLSILLNGTICLFVVPGLLSPLERLFGITTDIQLLEYSDLNNPLLGRLAIEIPATYAHSLMMGQLAEAAADAIGANGLMARVCAYYHDIGKLRRPEYFAENQTGYNIHEDLSPRLSARAIASHVTEGVEFAREHHLPQPIVRGILEHHGTMLISFFYQQALDQQKHGDVREEDFRYPGPKPQSPETAILMICDGVESGVRSIKNPNEERIREFVSKIVQARASDRQFDECDLTLKKLDTIGEVLTRRIMTAMHARIAYPERPAVKEATNVVRIQGMRE
jgi:putative nucleotidyltransferase with HDIG domain